MMVLSCATCQKMNIGHKAIRSSRFVLSTLQTMKRIALDTIGTLEISHQFRFILVIIHTFYGYAELFPAKKVMAEAATDALCRNSCRVGTSSEIWRIAGHRLWIRHWRACDIISPKEENGIVKRANKDHIRNILSNRECVKSWPQTLGMTEKLLSSSVKQSLRASPETLLFGNVMLHEPSIVEELDRLRITWQRCLSERT